MVLYYFLFTPVLFFAWLSVHDLRQCLSSQEILSNERPKKFFFCLSGALAAAILFFREGVGADYYKIYAQGYSDAANGAESRYEIGFDILQQACLFVSDDYHVLFFVCAVITVALVYYAIYKWSKMPLLSILIFLLCGLFFFSTNAIRQAISIALFLNAIPYITKGKFLNYCCWIIVAALFHQSAIVLILLYCLRFVKLNLLKAGLLCLVVVLLGNSLVPVSLQIGSLMSDQFAIYARLEHYLEGDIDLLDLGYTVIAYVIFWYVQRGDKKLYSNDDETRILTNILFIGLLIVIMTGYMFILFRFARYITPVLIFYIPNLVSRLKTHQERRNISLLIALCFVMTSFVVYGYLEIDQAVPYQTFLFSE